MEVYSLMMFSIELDLFMMVDIVTSDLHNSSLSEYYTIDRYTIPIQL